MTAAESAALVRQYYGAARDLEVRKQQQREGGGEAAAHVRTFQEGPRVPVDIGGPNLCEGYQAGRIREMLMVAAEILSDSQEQQGGCKVRGGPWLRTNRGDWSPGEREALAAVQEILRDIPPGYDRPAGSGKLPGFPADVAVKYEALLECGNPAWERLGRLIRGNTRSSTAT